MEQRWVGIHEGAEVGPSYWLVALGPGLLEPFLPGALPFQRKGAWCSWEDMVFVNELLWLILCTGIYPLGQRERRDSLQTTTVQSLMIRRLLCKERYTKRTGTKNYREYGVTLDSVLVFLSH